MSVVRSIRGNDFFVCDYTGALISYRYYIPDGRQKIGSFCTLPVLLRSVFEEEGCKYTARFKKVKSDVEEHFFQPDVPLQPELKMEDFPVSDLFRYLEQLDKGAAWTLVKGAQTIDEFNSLNNKKRRKKRK